MKAELHAWGQELVSFKLPRWHELPEIDLYMDQVLTLVERYLAPVIRTDKHTLLTASMVNNYVKLGLIPPPVKKRYNRKHLAFLLAITSLKQVLTIPEIKQGILYQGEMVGIRVAYDLFCTEQETALAVVLAQVTEQVVQPTFDQKIPVEMLAVRAATLSFAMKLLAEKTIELEEIYLKEHGAKKDE